MKKINHFFILIFLISFILCIEFPFLSAQESEWWNSDWTKRQEIILHENSYRNLNSYSILIDISYDTDMKSDFSDLRFVQDNHISELNHWIEKKVDESYAKVWVMLPSLISDSDTSIYMYYGNTAAPTTSNFNNAFLYADDFETYTLNNYNMDGKCNSAWIEDGKLNFDYILGPCTITPDIQHQLINMDYVVEEKVSADNICVYTGVIGYMPTFDAGEGGYTAWYHPNQQRFGIHGWTYGNWIQYIDIPTLADRYYEVDMIFNGFTNKVAILDNNEDYSVRISDSRSSQGYYGMTSYEGCTKLGQTSVDWFRVRPYAPVEPSYIFGEEVSGGTGPGPDLTERVEILEQEVLSLNEQITELNNKNQEQDDKISILEITISSLQEMVDDFIDKITIYFRFLPEKTKEEILCNYLKENNEISIEDLGLYCEIIQGTKKSSCVCNAI